MSLSITRQSHPAGAVVLALAGDLTAETAERLQQAMVQEIAPWRRIVIDLRQLRFIDGAGLGALLLGYQRTQQDQAFFSLAAAPKRVDRLLEKTGLICVFDLFGTVEEALDLIPEARQRCSGASPPSISDSPPGTP